jgi:oligoribonuclease
MTKPEDSQYVCFVDLECTGNRPLDQIIEIGAVMTDRNLNELSSKQIVLSGPYEMEGETIFLSRDGQFERMDPFVVNMHTKNGLLADCAKSVTVLSDADAKMTEWIRKYTSGDHIPLAGSGVSHFDRAFIRKDFPKFDKYLSYWAYDTGVIRRTLKLFGIDASFADTTDDKTHRALDDVRAHVEEMRRYKKMFSAWDDLGYGLAESIGLKQWPG